MSLGTDESSMESFMDDVRKDIIVEACSTVWWRPRQDDMVLVHIRPPAAQADVTDIRQWTCAWKVGMCSSAFPCALRARLPDGLDVDRCVRTMRQGEQAVVRPRLDPTSDKSGNDAAPGVTLQLLRHERAEDVFGNASFVRIHLSQGSGLQTPRANTELRIRSSCCRLPYEVAASSTDASECGSYVGLGGTSLEGEDDIASDACADLLRVLLHRFGGCVQVRGSERTVASSVSGASSQPAEMVLSVSQGDKVILDRTTCRGARMTEAYNALKATLLPDVAPTAGSGNATSSSASPREVNVSINDAGICTCDVDDWMPQSLIMTAVAELRSGSRCLIRIRPAEDSASVLEYRMEVVQVMPLEDISLDECGRVMKKVVKQGEGFEKPLDGSVVTARLKCTQKIANDTVSLLDEETVTFTAGGKLVQPSEADAFCVCVEEAVLTMKRGEVSEIRVTDAAMLEQLKTKGYVAMDGSLPAAVVLQIELLDFTKTDMYSLEEAARVAHCAERKEVGSRFFEDNEPWRALKRYQHVINTVKYIDHWKVDSAKAEAVSLRRLCYLNTAACQLRLHKWSDADESCKAVLNEDPDNVKALFRRGQAKWNLQLYQESEYSFRRVRDLDKDNKEAARMLVQVRQRIKTEAEQQKVMFSRMVKGIASDKTMDASIAMHAAAVASSSRNGDASSHFAAVPDDGISFWCWTLCSVTLIGSVAGIFLARKRL